MYMLQGALGVSVVEKSMGWHSQGIYVSVVKKKENNENAI
jgi:hypothetical protein